MPLSLKKSNSIVIHNQLISSKQISLSVVRFDQVHPIISGNKLYKLHYFLEDHLQKNRNLLITFGGAYSNHLVATAYACKEKNIPCIGIVRGEQPAVLSPTLIQCVSYGMQLKFISREEYTDRDSAVFREMLLNEFGSSCTIIPEGGYHPMGAAGAAWMMESIDEGTSHICCASGTATTVAGLLTNKKITQQVIAIPVLKGMLDLKERLLYLTGKEYTEDDLFVAGDYHFGGYAKKTPQLLAFMNDVYNEFELPTDFVYTAKMLYGAFDLVNNNYFPPGSKIACLHTGGLQGNQSLPVDTLTF